MKIRSWGGLGGDSEGFGGDLANKGDPEVPGDDFWMHCNRFAQTAAASRALM